MNAAHAKKLESGFRAGDLLDIYEDTMSWYSVDDEWLDGGWLVEHSYAVFLEDVKLQNEDRTFIKVLVSRGIRVVLARYVRKCP
jgi:hypothetical protein